MSYVKPKSTMAYFNLISISISTCFGVTGNQPIQSFRYEDASALYSTRQEANERFHRVASGEKCAHTINHLISDARDT